MLSTENPPPDHPSCSSCRNPGLKGDERAVAAADHGKLVLHEEEAVAADLGTSGLAQDTHLPQFSIRDYVFNARSKDIGANWPFPHRFLDLCFKHGIQDILPPFEPPDLVRAKCSGKEVGPEKSTACLEKGYKKTLAEGDLLEKEDAADDIKCDPCWQLSRLVVESADRAQSPLLAKGSLGGKSCSDEVGIAGTTTSTISSHVQTDKIISKRSHQAHRSINEISASLESSEEVEVADPHHTCKRTEGSSGLSDRKCRLIVKLGGISESTRTEEILSNSSAASEPMASKICPVCKTFSSTSNTTLNAHIDQCLAVESTSKRAMTDVTRHRVKPRKKRLMVDICATAPSCTLEDLDRRNGTNWASEASLLMPNSEVRSESKRQRLAQVDFADDGDDPAVYFDSNGTKLRILSKFNDVIAPKAGEEAMPRKHVKDVKHGKSYLGGKKKHLAPKCSRYLKLKPQSKKLCSLKMYKDEICEALDQKHRIENHEEKEKSLSQLLKTRDHPIKASSCGTLRQWPCSKRTGLSKKFSNKVGCGRMMGDLAPPANRNPLIESNQLMSGDSPPERSHLLKFSRSSENSATFTRSKKLETASNAVNIADNGEESPKQVEGDFDQLNRSASVADDRNFKFSRSPESYLCPPLSKRVEIDASAIQTSSKLSKSQPFSQKAKRIVTLRKNVLFGKPSPSMEASKCSEIEKHPAYKKSRKDKRMAKKRELLGAFPSDSDEQDRLHNRSKTLGHNFARLSKGSKTHKLDVLKNVRRSETEESTDKASIGRRNLLDSGHVRDQAISLPVWRETTTSRRLDAAVECHSLDVVDMVDSQAEHSPHPFPSADIHPSKSNGRESAAKDVLISGDAEIASSKKAVEDVMARSSETQSSDEDVQAFHSYMQSPSPEDEYLGPLSQTEACVPPSAKIAFDDQGTRCADEVGDDLTGVNSQMTEADSRMEGDSLSDIQYPGSIAEPMLIQGPGRYLPSPGDARHGLQDNTSVTSSGPQFTQDQYKSADLDPSRSPASATSTISSPQTTRSESNCPDQKSSLGFPSVQDKLSVSYADTDSVVPSTTNTVMERMKLERENLKVTVLPTKEGTVFFTKESKTSVDQPCCCSRKEPQLLKRRSSMAPMMMSAKAKHMTLNPYSGQEISTSSNCLSSRMDEIPVLESSIRSVSMKMTSDGMAKFPNSSDFESASPPSQSHPNQPSPSHFLRLMGKNLMVMNKEEDEAMRLRRVPQHDASSPNDHPNAKYLTLLGFSTGSVPNQDGISFYQRPPNGSKVYGNPCNPLQNFNDGFPNGFRNHNNSNMHHTALLPPEGHQEAMNRGGFMGPVLQPGSSGQKTDPQPQKRLNKQPNSPLAYEIERTTPHCQHPKLVSAARPPSSMHEVIVIDPEPEVDLSKGNDKYVVGSRGKQPFLVGISPSAASNSNPRSMKAFSCFPLHNPFTKEPTVGPTKPSFLMSCPGVNASSTKQGASEGPGVLSQSPFMLPSPPTGYLNSALYYSPTCGR